MKEKDKSKNISIRLNQLKESLDNVSFSILITKNYDIGRFKDRVEALEVDSINIKLKFYEFANRNKLNKIIYKTKILKEIYEYLEMAGNNNLYEQLKKNKKLYRALETQLLRNE